MGDGHDDWHDVLHEGEDGDDEDCGDEHETAVAADDERVGEQRQDDDDDGRHELAGR